MNRRTYLLAAGTPFLTEYHVVEGSSDGPVCMITAGIHGNEVAGPLAAKKISRLQLNKGKLIIVPVVNKKAFRAGVRGFPDLNRTFPQSVQREASLHPLSSQLLQLALSYRPVMCLDLHEGWGFYQLSKQAFGQTIITTPKSLLLPRIHRVLKKVNRTIKNKVHHFATRHSVLPGSFRTAMTKIVKVPTVTVETAVSLPLPVRIQYQESIVEHFLWEIGLVLK